MPTFPPISDRITDPSAARPAFAAFCSRDVSANEAMFSPPATYTATNATTKARAARSASDAHFCRFGFIHAVQGKNSLA